MFNKELIEKCIAGERQAQEVLYRTYADKMYAVCLTYTKDEDEAADVLQEGFIRAFSKLNTFSFQGSFEGWLRRIMVNIALAHYQKKRKVEENLSVYKSETQSVVGNVLDDINAEEVVKLVNQLPEKAGMVLKLYAIEGYDHQEIAELMGTSVGTSKSQLNRARTLLKEALANLTAEEQRTLAG